LVGEDELKKYIYQSDDPPNGSILLILISTSQQESKSKHLFLTLADHLILFPTGIPLRSINMYISNILFLALWAANSIAAAPANGGLNHEMHVRGAGGDVNGNNGNNGNGGWGNGNGINSGGYGGYNGGENDQGNNWNKDQGNNWNNDQGNNWNNDQGNDWNNGGEKGEGVQGIQGTGLGPDANGYASGY